MTNKTIKTLVLALAFAGTVLAANAALETGV